jgi:hypothetical protein
LHARLTGLISMALVAGLFLAASAVGAAADPDRWRAEGWKTDFSKSASIFQASCRAVRPGTAFPPIDDPSFLPVYRSLRSRCDRNR